MAKQFLQQGEINMARKIGFKRAFIGIIDNDTELLIKGDKGLSDSGIFEVNAKTSLGTLQAAITGLAPTATKIYGSNQNVDVSQQGVGNAQMTFSANDIPAEVVYKLAGMKQDSKTKAWALDANTIPPKSAVVLEAQDSKGRPLYFAMTKGTFGPQEVTLNTNTDTQQITTDSMTFSALQRKSDSKVHMAWLPEDEVPMDDVLKAVFPEAAGTVTKETVSGK